MMEQYRHTDPQFGTLKHISKSEFMFILISVSLVIGSQSVDKFFLITLVVFGMNFGKEKLLLKNSEKWTGI